MIKLPRVKFQWAASRTTPGDWYLGLLGFYTRKGGRGRGVALSLRGAALWGLVACVAAYFGGAGYVWWKLERRPYNFVRYSDMLLYPLRKDKINGLRGQALIAEGMDDLKAQRWREGVMKLRIGLEKYPRDLKARLEIARFFLAAKVRPKAQEMLLGGLSYGWPGRYYLENAVAVANAGEDQELVIELCDRALALHDAARQPAADRRWLVEQRIRALLAESRSDDALAMIEREAAALGDPTLSEFRLLALLQASRLPEAVAFAESWRARAGAEPQVLRLLARSYREAGRLDDMARVLAELRAAEPSDPRTHVFAFIQKFLAGRAAAGHALLEDYIFRFGGTPANFSIAAEPLAEIGRLDELDVLLAAAADRGIRDVRLMAARLQALIAERRWSEATQQIGDIRSALPAGRASPLDLFQYLVAAAADPADGAQSSLATYVRDRQLSMSAYRQCIEVLRKAGRADTARQIVTFAEGVFPANRYLAETRVALDADIAARKAAAEAAKPVVVAAPSYASAGAFYAQLDEVAGTRGAEAAVALIRELRQSRPAWLLGEDESLTRRELGYFAEGDDIVALQGAVRRYLNNDRVRIQHVITVATRLQESGRSEGARVLLNEILRKAPGQPAASALLRQWFPAAQAPAVSAPVAAPVASPRS